MAPCPSSAPTPQPGRPLQPFPTARGEAGSWGAPLGPGSSALPASSTGRDVLGGAQGHKREASGTRGRNGSEGRCSCQGRGGRLLLYRANIRGGLCSRGLRVQGIFLQGQRSPKAPCAPTGGAPMGPCSLGRGNMPRTWGWAPSSFRPFPAGTEVATGPSGGCPSSPSVTHCPPTVTFSLPFPKWEPAVGRPLFCRAGTVLSFHLLLH